MTGGEFLSAVASRWHDYLNDCSVHQLWNAAINVVVYRAVSQQAAAADGHQPFVSYFSLTCTLIKTSMRRNLTTTIVFDELVVKYEQVHRRRCLRHHMLCCDVETVKFK